MLWRLFGPNVWLKERRKLVLVARESPPSTVRLRNLYEASQPEAAAMAKPAL